MIIFVFAELSQIWQNVNFFNFRKLSLLQIFSLTTNLKYIIWKVSYATFALITNIFEVSLMNGRCGSKFQIDATLGVSRTRKLVSSVCTLSMYQVSQVQRRFRLWFELNIKRSFCRFWPILLNFQSDYLDFWTGVLENLNNYFGRTTRRKVGRSNRILKVKTVL